MVRHIEPPTSPPTAPPVVEDLLIGNQKLRQAFFRSPVRVAQPRQVLVHHGLADPPPILVRSGIAFRSFDLPTGARAISHIILPGEIAGLEYVVLSHPAEEITTASMLRYHTLPVASVRELMTD